MQRIASFNRGHLVRLKYGAILDSILRNSSAVKRRFMPSLEKLVWTIAWDGGIAAEQDAVYSDLAHSLG